MPNTPHPASYMCNSFCQTLHLRFENKLKWSNKKCQTLRTPLLICVMQHDELCASVCCNCISKVLLMGFWSTVVLSPAVVGRAVEGPAPLQQYKSYASNWLLLSFVADTGLSWLGWVRAHLVLANQPLAKFLHSAYRVFHNPCPSIKNAVAYTTRLIINNALSYIFGSKNSSNIF